MATSTPNGPSKTIVIKLGTSSILSEHTHQPKLSILSSLVETCHELRSLGHKVVLVCSGAIGMGKVRMGMMGEPLQAAGPSSATAAGQTVKPPAVLGLGERQALAALGQLRLIALWDSLFGQLGISVAQVLLTRNDIADRPRFLNAKTTLQTLLSRFNAIPIVNENDTVSSYEMRFGDNDTLSAITAGLIDADYLFLLTDVDGLYTGNPRTDPSARRLGLIDSVAKVHKLVNVASQGSNFGTGGMVTKLIAADLATAAGVATVIVNGMTPENIVKVVQQELPEQAHSDDDGAQLVSSISSLDVQNEAHTIGVPPLENPPHTMFLPVRHPLKARKWSILHALHPTGTIIIDEGAYKRISRPESGGRLLPVGVIGVEGTWEHMQAVRLVLRRRVSSLSQAHNGDASGSSTPAPPSLSKRLNSYLRDDPMLTRSSSTSSHSAGATPPISVQGMTPPPSAHGAHSSKPLGERAHLLDDTAQDSDQAPLGKEDSAEWELVEIGRGLANYNSIECERIKGLNRYVSRPRTNPLSDAILSSQISQVLGYVDSDYIVDELALHALPSDPLR